MRCGHGKIPWGGHCAWIKCSNYLGKCATHKYYNRDKHDAKCEPTEETSE